LNILAWNNKIGLRNYFVGLRYEVMINRDSWGYLPAAAVIPAPIAYIKVVAVKKLVVGFLRRAGRSAALRCDWSGASHPCGDCCGH